MKPSDYSLQFAMNNQIASLPMKKQMIIMKNKALKRLIYGLLAFLISLPLFSFKFIGSLKKDTLPDSDFKIKTIVVDAGHGLRPSGAEGHFSPGASGSYSNERDVTLAIAKKLQIAIEKELNGVKVVMTRKTEED